MREITLHELAEDVLAANPDGTKSEWGTELDRVAGDQGDDIAAEVEAKKIAALGAYVANIKSDQERARQRERITERMKSAPKVTHEGRPLNPTLSVRTETGTQLTLWLDASPRQFVEAVLREQKVARGRLDSNKLRMKIADMCREDEALMDLPTVAEVCRELAVDPADLELEELSA